MNRKAALLVVLVFLLGVAMGAMGFYVATSRGFAAGPRGPKGSARVVEALTQKLALTEQQQAQLTAILEETKGKYHDLYEQIQPQIAEVRHQGRQKIRAILTPEQLPRFEEHLRQLDEQRKKMDEDRRKKNGK